MNRKIILASTSPRRIELLTKAGIKFEAVASDYEEDMTLPMEPKELAKFLSRGKAEAIAKNYEDAIIIGGDTFIAFNGKILGKPHTEERAREMLLMLSGHTHSVISGFTVMDTKSGKVISDTEEAFITFKNLSEKEIDDYVATGEPLSRAGAYAIQTIGENFIEKWEGDYDSIVGLPTSRVLEALKDLGVEI
ncbi:MAG: septum formation protein Maf [Candidatus Pacebacteria bacterium]|nr:septum formation protein Maf [Candidatus Paceibacterota bacterium]